MRRKDNKPSYQIWARRVGSISQTKSHTHRSATLVNLRSSKSQLWMRQYEMKVLVLPSTELSTLRTVQGYKASGPYCYRFLCPTRANCSLPITSACRQRKPISRLVPAKPHYTLSPLLLSARFPPLFSFLGRASSPVPIVHRPQ